MKQILQNMKTGRTSVEDIPIPNPRPKTALIQTAVSLVSAGTERMVVEFAEKNLLEKATARPDLVRQVVTKAKREGIIPTIEAAFNKLDQPMSLGYSSAGTIIETGESLTGYKKGDRVACAGGGFAVHAEYAVVPQNLLAKLPDEVDFESAAFTTLGAIAMQGIRLADPKIGESVCVIGMGLLGLLTAQIARASGCRVFGVDNNIDRVRLAEELGFLSSAPDSCLEMATGFTRGRGFDQVLICADTHSNSPVELAGQLSRDRGVVVAVGAVGFEIPRKLYYEKELEFKVSRSYGPGRYDTLYEEKGIDYPVGYVRWTEGRNLESFIDLLASKKIDVTPLITHRFPIEQADHAYDLITGKTGEKFLGVLLKYPQEISRLPLVRKISFPTPHASPDQKIKVGVLGAGNYGQSVFLPILKNTKNIELVGIASSSGISAAHSAKKFGFVYATSSADDLINDPHINAVVILTRHQSHASQVLRSLTSKKSVYCEKPLALTQEEVDLISEKLMEKDSSLLMVGFNRRFAPMAIDLKDFFANTAEPLLVNYRINAGYIPHNHWLHDPAQGGGRIIGEGCHFIDLLTYLVGDNPVSVTGTALSDNGKYNQDNVILTFKFPNGSAGTVTYIANGNKNFGKERIEVFSSGRIGILEDFRSLELITESRKKIIQSRLRQDKGHAAAWAAFLNAITAGGPPPIPYIQLIDTSRASFAAVQAIQAGGEIAV